MGDPLVIEVTRGERVESRHLVHVAAINGSGGLLLAQGDVGRPIYPRSAIKVFQAIPLIESGAATRFALGQEELSLACASHSGEPGHVELASRMLEAAGLGENALECGCHWPFDIKVATALASRGGRPSPLGNNCSGKHCGFLCTAVHLGEPTAGYVESAHPVQRRVKAVLEAVTGTQLGEAERGTDGCSIPTYAARLEAWAAGFARLFSERSLEPERAAAGRRLIAACMAEPWFMAGTGRACLSLMQAAPGRVFVKTGAEGVFCGAIPELAIGFALKVEDGATRAAEIATAETLSTLLRDADPTLAERYREMARHPLVNWEKRAVGEIRVAR